MKPLLLPLVVLALSAFSAAQQQPKLDLAAGAQKAVSPIAGELKIGGLN
jgi:hypothetical protein